MDGIIFNVNRRRDKMKLTTATMIKETMLVAMKKYRNSNIPQETNKLLPPIFSYDDNAVDDDDDNAGADVLP